MQFPVTPQFRVTAQRFRNQASCDCGWVGKRQILRGSAVVDAYIHGAQSGHLPADNTLVAIRDTGVLLHEAS